MLLDDFKGWERGVLIFIIGVFVVLVAALWTFWGWLMRGQMEPGATKAVAAVVSHTAQPPDTPLPTRTPWPSPTGTMIPTDKPDPLGVFYLPSKTPRPTRTPLPSLTPTPTLDLTQAWQVLSLTQAQQQANLSYVHELVPYVILAITFITAYVLFSLWTVKKVFVHVVDYVVAWWGGKQPESFEAKVLRLWDEGNHRITGIVRVIEPENYSGGGATFWKVKAILEKHGRYPLPSDPEHDPATYTTGV